MRKNRVLAKLFPTVRGEVLAATLTQPEKWWYLSELAQFLRTTPSSLQRELKTLADVGVLQQRREGTRAYFKAERNLHYSRSCEALLKRPPGCCQHFSRRLNRFGIASD